MLTYTSVIVTHLSLCYVGRILLPRVGRSGNVCVDFRYHMYGFHIGRLEVYIRRGSSNLSPTWTLAGEQGTQWKQKRLTMYIEANDRVKEHLLVFFILAFQSDNSSNVLRYFSNSFLLSCCLCLSLCHCISLRFLSQSLFLSFFFSVCLYIYIYIYVYIYMYIYISNYIYI